MRQWRVTNLAGRVSMAGENSDVVAVR